MTTPASHSRLKSASEVKSGGLSQSIYFRESLYQEHPGITGAKWENGFTKLYRYGENRDLGNSMAVHNGRRLQIEA